MAGSALTAPFGSLGFGGANPGGGGVALSAGETRLAGDASAAALADRFQEIEEVAPPADDALAHQMFGPHLIEWFRCGAHRDHPAIIKAKPLTLID